MTKHQQTPKYSFNMHAIAYMKEKFHTNIATSNLGMNTQQPN
jgi:hypothetical protein